MPVPSLRPHGPAPGTLPAGTDWDGSLPLTGPRAGSNGRSHPAEGSTVVRKTTAGLTATVVQLCAALLTAFVLARSLGPELLGQYYLLYTLTLTSALFGSLGVEAANSVFVGRGEEHPGRVHTASLLLTVLLGGTAVLLAAAAYPIPWLGLTGRVDPIHYTLALATVPFILYQNLVWSILIGTGHLVLMSRTKILVALLRLVGDMTVVGFLWMGASHGLAASRFGVRGLLISFLLCSALGAVFLLWLTLPVARPQALRTRGLLGRLTGFGIRSHLGTIAGQLHSRADTFILNAFHGTAAVGLYSVAVQAAELPILFFTAIQNAVFARVSGGDRDEATRMVSFLVRLGCAAWLALVGLGLTVVPRVITWMLGPAYQTSGEAFMVLIGGTAAVGISRLCNPYFLGQLKRPGLLSGLAWLNVAINLAACALLVPGLSVLGAATASLVSYLAGLVILLFFYCRLSQQCLFEVLRPRRDDFQILLNALRSLTREAPAR